MKLISALILLILLVSITGMAGSYPINYNEDFEDGILNPPFICGWLVDEPPDDPSAAYALIESPSLNGSQGLSLYSSEDGFDPWVHYMFISCSLCGDGALFFEVAEPPGKEFGALRLEIISFSNESLVYEEHEPGSYEFIVPADIGLLSILFSGHDIIIDEIQLYLYCDCPPIPTEKAIWGVIKSMYR